MKLDLGCGLRKRAGFVGVDLSPDCGADIVHDLRITPWPFDDASVDEAYCSHFLEHLDGAERIAFMEDLYRVLKPGATALIITPYWTSAGAVQDPTHKWPPIAEQSYLYFNAQARNTLQISHYDIRCDFDATFGGVVAPEFQHLSPQEQIFASKHYFNVVLELHATLTRR